MWSILVLSMVRRRSSPAKTSQKSAQQRQSPVSLITWSAFQSHVRYLSTAEQGQIHTAFLLGQEVHAGGKRKSGEPYFNHCIAVAHMLADMLADAETIIAALLHDSIEDTSLTLPEIEETFGTAIRKVVDGLTKLRAEDVSGRSTLDEKIETLRKIFTLMEEDVRIMVIKLVDRLHNMQTIEYLLPEKQRLLAEETLDVYVKIADQLCMQDLRDELAELCLRVTEPVTLGKLLALRAESETQGKQIISSMARSLQTSSRSLSVDIQLEHKRWRTLRSQLAAQGSAITGLTSITAVFLCDDIPSCYQILGALHQDWRREALSFQDFINSPMINGYQGVHTTIILEDGTRVRCKIRTHAMQEYARKGVATQCFDQEALGILRYLPWAQRISPLASDTMERSKDFWESLQSDILGDSIVIHSMDDQMVLLPDGATALDGAFYCIGDDALRVKTVKVDGREVPLQSQLVNGVSLAVELHSRPVVTREWLQWVRTGVASTNIRAGLSRQPREKKIAAGRELLEQVMAEKKKGLLAEFDEKSLLLGVRSLGFSSMDEVAIAITEGRIAAIEVYAILFEKKKEKKLNIEVKRKRCTLRFTMQRDDIETLRRLVDVYQKFTINLSDIRIWGLPLSEMRRFTLKAMLSQEECEVLKEEIERAGGKNTEVMNLSDILWSKLALPVLILLWGLDSVFAKVFISSGVSPFDLTILRFGVLLFLSLGYLIFVTQTKGAPRLKLALPRNKALLLSVGAIFCTAIFTYISLQYLSASAYASLITIGAIFAFMPSINLHEIGSRRVTFLLCTFAFFMSSVFLLLNEQGSLLGIGALSGMGAGLGFALYSVTSERYQLQESIRTRYPIFIFYLSLFAFFLSLPLLLVSNFSIMSSSLFFPAIIFLAVFTSLPYLLYFQMLKRKGIEVTRRHIPLFLPIVVLSESIIQGSVNWLWIVPVAFSLCWVFLYKDKISIDSET